MTIPAELPIIHVTDSNNARSLQKRFRNSDTFTHRKIVRSIKQGIDYSIANHLAYLTSQWLHEDQLDANATRLYKKGEEICKKWAENNEN